jgi:hypothetical protein
MPKAQVKKETPVSKPLAEGMARVRDKETGKELEVDALHALTVLGKQGKYEILEHKATLGALSAFCDIHEIRYPGGGTVEQLVALAVRK